MAASKNSYINSIILGLVVGVVLNSILGFLLFGLSLGGTFQPSPFYLTIFAFIEIVVIIIVSQTVKNRGFNLILVSLVILIIAAGLLYQWLSYWGYLSSRFPTSCYPEQGFICNVGAYSSSTGNVTLSIGMLNGLPVLNWTTGKILFVPDGTYLPNGVPPANLWNNATTLPNGLQNDGKVYSVNLHVSGPVTFWQWFYGVSGIPGTLYANYTNPSGTYQQQIATMLINR